MRSAAALVRQYRLDVEAEDLVQDAVVTALQRQAEFDGGNLGGWLYAIMLNHARNLRKARIRRRTSVVSDLGAPDGGDGSDLLDQPMAASQDVRLQWREMAEALDRLQPEEIRIIRLAKILGHTLEEIAEELALPLGTVKSRLSRAVAKLRAEIEPPRQRRMALIRLAA